MDLQLTRRGEYAVRAAVGLAQGNRLGGYRKLREVSEEMGIPSTYAQEILTLLMKAGLVEARAGKRGGYRLVKEPAELSLLEVVEAAEGPLRLERCTFSGGACSREERVCAVHAMLEQANSVLVASLRSQSFEKVVERHKKERVAPGPKSAGTGEI